MCDELRLWRAAFGIPYRSRSWGKFEIRIKIGYNIYEDIYKNKKWPLSKQEKDKKGIKKWTNLHIEIDSKKRRGHQPSSSFSSIVRFASNTFDYLTVIITIQVVDGVNNFGVIRLPVCSVAKQLQNLTNTNFTFHPCEYD